MAPSPGSQRRYTSLSSKGTAPRGSQASSPQGGSKRPGNLISPSWSSPGGSRQLDNSQPGTPLVTSRQLPPENNQRSEANAKASSSTAMQKRTPKASMQLVPRASIQSSPGQDMTSARKEEEKVQDSLQQRKHAQDSEGSTTEDDEVMILEESQPLGSQLPPLAGQIQPRSSTQAAGTQRAAKVCTKKHRTMACSKCENCRRPNCGLCAACRNMRQYGGPGTGKQKCADRACAKPVKATCEDCGQRSILDFTVPLVKSSSKPSGSQQKLALTSPVPKAVPVVQKRPTVLNKAAAKSDPDRKSSPAPKRARGSESLTEVTVPPKSALALSTPDPKLQLMPKSASVPPKSAPKECRDKGETTPSSSQRYVEFYLYTERFTVPVPAYFCQQYFSEILICLTQCCGSGMFIPDPNYSHPGSWIRMKEFKYFNPKNCFSALGNMIRVVHPGSGFLTHPGSRGQKGTGSRILDPQHRPHLYELY